MVFTYAVSAVTVIAVMLSIIFKPYIKIGKFNLGLYCLIASFGAIILICFNSVSLKDIGEAFFNDTAVNPLKILILFLSMTLISVFLGDAGFFDYVAEKIIDNSNGNKFKFFLSVYFIAGLLTVFTSNDIIILTFTPPICIFCKRAKISPFPYLFSEFVAANTFSMALIIGNPTNIYLATSYNIDFFYYLEKMIIPTLSSALIGFIILYLLFRKDLKEKPEKGEPLQKITVEKVPFIISLICLILCVILLSLSNIIGIEMWLICLVFALVLTVFEIVYRIIDGSAVKLKTVFKKLPYEIIPFVLSMFVIVSALSETDFVSSFTSLFLSGKKEDALIYGLLSATSSNLLNNIPMSVLFQKLADGNIYAVLGSVIGSNIGAFITPVGALAGIMWNKILKDYGFNFSFKRFCVYGLTCAIPVVISSTLLLSVII